MKKQITKTEKKLKWIQLTAYGTDKSTTHKKYMILSEFSKTVVRLQILKGMLSDH